MKRQHFAALAVASFTVLIAAGIALAANDRFALKAPNGIEFSQFKGYETWDMVASATSDNAHRPSPGASSPFWRIP
jgi:hypothetical protein